MVRPPRPGAAVSQHPRVQQSGGQVDLDVKGRHLLPFRWSLSLAMWPCEDSHRRRGVLWRLVGFFLLGKYLYSNRATGKPIHLLQSGFSELIPHLPAQLPGRKDVSCRGVRIQVGKLDEEGF